MLKDSGRWHWSLEVGKVHGEELLRIGTGQVVLHKTSTPPSKSPDGFASSSMGFFISHEPVKALTTTRSASSALPNVRSILTRGTPSLRSYTITSLRAAITRV